MKTLKAVSLFSLCLPFFVSCAALPSFTQTPAPASAPVPIVMPGPPVDNSYSGLADLRNSCKDAPEGVNECVDGLMAKHQKAKIELLEKMKELKGENYAPMDNPKGKLSQLSFICGGKAFVKIFSGLSVADVTRLWNDLTVLEHETLIREVHMFINSPGGDAFSGLALADLIERAKKHGFHITAHASGIIASAAVPVFAVCNKRLAAPGTIFMVHEAALWKWPGRETASDIESQNELMKLLRSRYIGKLVDNTTLNKTKWRELEKKTTWFSVEKAQTWGLVDEIE